MFQKVRPPVRIYQGVADQIEEAIISGRLKPGDRLPSERELADTFDISRRTMREALLVVKEKGLIEVNKGAKGGAIVKALTTEQISQSLALLIRFKKVSWDHLAHFRSDLDGAVASTAAQRVTPEEIAHLKSLVADLKALIEGDDFEWDELIDLDRQIHLALVRIAGNPIHEWVLRTVLDNVVPYYEVIKPRKKEYVTICYQELADLVQAVAERDSERAGALAQEHIRTGYGYL